MPHHEPNRALARAQLETIAWDLTPEDKRGRSGSKREVLLTTTDGATLVPLGELTDFQLRRYIGPGRLEEAGDMRKNGPGEDPCADFVEELRSMIDIGDRQIYYRVTGTQAFVQFYNVPQGIETGAERENNRLMLSAVDAGIGRVKVELTVRGPSFGEAYKLRSKTASARKAAEYVAEFLNRAAQKAPYGHAFDNYDKNGRASDGHRKNSREEELSFDLSEYGAAMNDWNGGMGDPIYAVGSYAYSGKIHPDRDTIESALSGLERLKRGEKSRTRKRELSTLIDQTQEILNAWPMPAGGYDRSDTAQGAREEASAGGRVFRTGRNDPRPNASRAQADETAARELSLYIENEYSLIGAPNSQGKAIENNLLGHLRRGNFDIDKAEIAYMHLMESGAKKYAKEFADPADWNTIFSKPTRELVAHEFATSFYAEHKGR